VLQPGDRVVVAHGGTGGRGVVAPSRLQKQKELDKEYQRAQVGDGVCAGGHALTEGTCCLKHACNMQASVNQETMSTAGGFSLVRKTSHHNASKSCVCGWGGGLLLERGVHWAGSSQGLVWAVHVERLLPVGRPNTACVQQVDGVCTQQCTLESATWYMCQQIVSL